MKIQSLKILPRKSNVGLLEEFPKISIRHKPCIYPLLSNIFSMRSVLVLMLDWLLLFSKRVNRRVTIAEINKFLSFKLSLFILSIRYKQKITKSSSRTTFSEIDLAKLVSNFK